MRLRHTLIFPMALLCLVATLLGGCAGVTEPPQPGSQTARTSGPSPNPILRIETGTHTAPIGRIGVDAAGRFLVTGSHDKTVRVWSLPEGQLVQTLRVPIGEGKEGQVYAVAISPDGSTVAASGWTTPTGTNENIYLFDRSSGRLIRRLRGLPIVILHLTYSRDGRYLAASLGGRNGIRVYHTDTWRLAAEDQGYGDSSYSADFSHDGRLAGYHLL